MAMKKNKNKCLKFGNLCGNMYLQNPVITASGTFSEDFSQLIDLKRLGAIVTKTVTLKPRVGNPPPRIFETESGMLNAIGLSNDGINAFVEEKLPILSQLGIPIILSIAGESSSEFTKLTKTLNGTKGISALELNISCPNIKRTKKRGSKVKLIAQDPKAVFDTVKTVRRLTKLTLITKLSPNVTDITSIAKAAESGGSDAISLINTVFGMAIDLETRKPQLGNVIGGLSGPAIKPIALRMVWEVARAVKIPTIGVGGIMNAQDAVEFLIAGATAVEVGTASIVNPKATIEIIDGIEKFMKRNKIKDIKKLIGSLKCKTKS